MYIHDARLDKSTCHMPGGSQGKLPQYSQYQIFIQTTINYHYDYIPTNFGNIQPHYVDMMRTVQRKANPMLPDIDKKRKSSKRASQRSMGASLGSCGGSAVCFVNKCVNAAPVWRPVLCRAICRRVRQVRVRVRA